MIANLERQFKQIQTTIYSSFSQLESSNEIDISEDAWKRPEGDGQSI